MLLNFMSLVLMAWVVYIIGAFIASIIFLTFEDKKDEN